MIGDASLTVRSAWPPCAQGAFLALRRLHGMADSADNLSSTLVEALRRQLGSNGTSVELIQTHISWVLLAGHTAWKIKKPVRFGFVDFGRLEQRRHFCAEELRLNRRFAPSIYLEVVAISGTPQAPRLGDGSAPIEYALRMHRFPPRALLSERLADGTLLPADIDALAQRIAALHAQAEVAAFTSPFGRPDDIVGVVRSLLERLRALGVEVDDLMQWLATRAPLLTPLWQQRREAGWVRECHGDLHLGNTVVLDDGVTAFDCIEFDPALRWIDVQSDVAFLAMDLLAHGRADLAWRFVNAWLDTTGDHAGVPLLRFHLVHRALVRTLVCGLCPPAGTTEPSADAYLALARRLAFEPPKPRLLVTHGLSGSGKTQLSQRLLECAGALRLRSDVERKRLFGLGALEASAPSVPGGIYGAEAHRRTYERLLELARGLLRAGCAVIVDAACLRRAERDRFRSLAAEVGVPFALLDCQSDLRTLRQRVRARQQRRDDASEADESVLDRQLETDEPLSPVERTNAIVVRTDGALDIATIAARWRVLDEPVPGEGGKKLPLD
jgi:aminoglycoside phosphotransferase family enzyme/predicted kinase